MREGGSFGANQPTAGAWLLVPHKRGGAGRHVQRQERAATHHTAPSLMPMFTVYRARVIGFSTVNWKPVRDGQALVERVFLVSLTLFMLSSKFPNYLHQQEFYLSF